MAVDLRDIRPLIGRTFAPRELSIRRAFERFLVDVSHIPEQD